MRPPKCYWQLHSAPTTPDEEPAWLSGCGELRTLPETPSEHGLLFCPFCGGQLIEPETEPAETPETEIPPYVRKNAIREWEDWLDSLDGAQAELFADDPTVTQREYANPMLNIWATQLGTTPATALRAHGPDAYLDWVHSQAHKHKTKKHDELLKHLEGQTRNAKA